MYLLKGLASTPEVDGSKHLVEIGSLIWNGMPPLLFDHDPKVKAGTIKRLAWGTKGLEIECEAEDRYANMPAFSVRFSVQKHRIVGFGLEAHGIVKAGTLYEVSLVHRPCCKSALVTSAERMAPKPHVMATPEEKAIRKVQMEFWLNEMRGGQ